MQANKRKHYWFVWNQKNGNPGFRHRSEEEAIVEAQRLAAKHPGATFHVLKVIGKAVGEDFLPFSEKEKRHA